MLKYMSYLFANIRKKWSTYLIPLFSALILAATLLPQILLDKSGQPIITRTLVYYYFMPFVFGGMFVGTKALNIFKDGEEDGTELLIVSKPISRIQIVFGKFISLYLLIFGFSIWTFFTAYGIGVTDSAATSSEILEFAGSYALGSLIVMTIFSAVIAFFASVLGKIGTMSLSIILPAMLPIVSFILVPIGGGNVYNKLSGEMQQHSILSVSYDSLSGKTTTSDTRYIYDDSVSDYKAGLQEQNDNWYKYVAPVDVWQHMVGFYQLFQDNKLGLRSSGIKVTKQEVQLSAKDGIELKDTNNDFLFVPIDSSENGIINDVSINTLVDFIRTDNSILDEIKTKVDGTKDFGENSESVGSYLEENDEIRNMMKTKFGLDEYDVSKFGATVLAVLSKNDQVNLGILSETNSNNGSYNIFSLNDGLTKKVEVLQIKKSISSSVTVIVYVLIAIALSGLVIFRYYRRDFK